ncbi:MAG: YraN family protein [Leptospira sp.]|nr:YraN family protein [Leptospira sp.]
MRKVDLGKLGESLALTFLLDTGHSILFTNYRNSFGEIDIISLCKEVLYCTEVKFRTTNENFHPLQVFNETKQNRMKKLYYYFIKEYPLYSHLTVSFSLAHIDEKREVHFYSHLF